MPLKRATQREKEGVSVTATNDLQARRAN